MIKPKNRKICGISAVVAVELAVFYSLYVGNNEVATSALWLCGLIILAWYTSEAFVAGLIAKRLNLDLVDEIKNEFKITTDKDDNIIKKEITITKEQTNDTVK